MNTQPEALRLADAVFVAAALLPLAAPERQALWQAAALLRTQHADLERKDALLRQARLHVASNIAVNSGDSKAEDLYDAITKELQ